MQSKNTLYTMVRTIPQNSISTNYSLSFSHLSLNSNVFLKIENKFLNFIKFYRMTQCLHLRIILHLGRTSSTSYSRVHNSIKTMIFKFKYKKSMTLHLGFMLKSTLETIPLITFHYWKGFKGQKQWKNSIKALCLNLNKSNSNRFIIDSLRGQRLQLENIEDRYKKGFQVNNLHFKVNPQRKTMTNQTSAVKWGI
jgi:hypothetical protein